MHPWKTVFYVNNFKNIYALSLCPVGLRFVSNMNPILGRFKILSLKSKKHGRIGCV